MVLGDNKMDNEEKLAIAEYQINRLGARIEALLYALVLSHSYASKIQDDLAAEKFKSKQKDTTMLAT
jgi:hypothetical protein